MQLFSPKPITVPQRRRIPFRLLLLFWLPFAGLNGAQAAGKLTVYCSVQHNVCEKMVKTFAQKYHVDTKFVRNSTGATLAKIKAEQALPQADIWYGGTIEPHFQAAQLGLLQPYRSPYQAETMPQFKRLLEEKGDYTAIGYIIVLGIGVNTEKFKQLGIRDYPRCWKDLLDPRLKDQIQMPDPRNTGTGYTFIATLIQLWGEEEAFRYLNALHNNISQYAKSGTEKSNLSRGDAAVTIGFVNGYASEKEKGAPVEAILPCDGDSYSLGGISILKGARNPDNAKLFMDWALTADAQEIAWREEKMYQIPTNIHAQASPNSVNPKDLKLIDFDFERFGSDTESKRLIEKWLTEVKLN
ncbi:MULTISPECIES: ABC transporter substrate-binding protein [Pasteurellaceae]|uniref:ABC transporter substrate-binding protein n=1 Tax=Pasteurellaceae TaxID=712 RepID=UPI00050947BC